MPSGDHPPPPRPAAIDLAAAVLVFGGLLGFSQLALGEYVVTGSLPAKGPIMGVATIAYAASIALGVAVRAGRAWLLAVNLALVVAILPLPLVLALLHGLAGAVLIARRRWFADVAAWRNGVRDVPG
jgi:hypothetical protein